MQKFLIFAGLMLTFIFSNGFSHAAASNPYNLPPALQSKVNAGDPAALYKAATEYYLPVATAPSDDEAEGDGYGDPSRITDQNAFNLTIRSLEEAGAKKYYEAYRTLGVLFRIGITGTPDMKKAAGYFEEGAKGGDVGCFIELGYLYGDGLGIPMNRSRAYACTQIAIALDPEAHQAVSTLVGTLSQKMTAEEKQVAEKIVARWQAEKVL